MTRGGDLPRLGRALVVTTLLTAVLLVFRFGADTSDRFLVDVGSVSAYVTAVGTLYSILAAFTIYVVWTQFNETTTAIANEAKDLVDLYRYATYLRDPEAQRRFKAAIQGYCAAVAADEWEKMALGAQSVTASDAFEMIFAAVGSVRFDDDRDEAAWSVIIRKFEDISDSRTRRLNLAATRVPALLRILLLSASGALVAGFFMLGIENDFLAVVITALPSLLVVLVIDAVGDIDNPFGGHWSIEPIEFLGVSPALDGIDLTAGAADSANV